MNMVMNMYGINLNKSILFKHASMRYFENGEHHVNRTLPYDVLLLVFEGTLRFSEDGVEYEVNSGHYHIQKAYSVQRGDYVSDSPKYFYVHFNAEWTDSPYSLATDGRFSYTQFKEMIKTLDKLSHSVCSYIEKTKIFYEILCTLDSNNHQNQSSIANIICNYLNNHYINDISLDDICSAFNYSKNHIINIFKDEYHVTPIEYLNDLRLKKTMHLLEGTSKSAEDISVVCGFKCYSNFYKLFKRKTGLSPTEWRKKIIKNPSIIYDVYTENLNDKNRY